MMMMTAPGSSPPKKHLAAQETNAMHAVDSASLSPVLALGGPGSSFSKPKAAFKQSKTAGVWSACTTMMFRRRKQGSGASWCRCS